MMKLGFLTNALVSERLNDIQKMAEWAQENGFQAIEVGPKLPFDERAFASVIASEQVEISALTYCRNFLSQNQEESEYHQKELFARIQAAGRLGIPLVVTSTGIQNRKVQESHDSYESIRPLPIKSLDAVTTFLERALDFAERANVKLAVENCPLMGNILISPEMWQLLLTRFDSPHFGLAYDPSHLIWQMIDPYQPILEFGKRILHVHAKDTEILRERLSRTGILTDFSWWRYRLPGLGELNWTRFLSNLYEIDFKGTISIEHEDPVWGGTIDRIQQGLLIGKNFLQQNPAYGM